MGASLLVGAEWGVSASGSEGPAPVEVAAPAKLTVSLEVTGVRPDGYHLLSAEFVTVSLFDTLQIAAVEGDAASTGPDLTVAYESADGGSDWPWAPVAVDRDNLVRRALETVGARASVRLVKRIPPGAGLGGGSADAAAVLRWAGRSEVHLAASLGADVPFCAVGGRARVGGVGEVVTPLPHEDRIYTLLVPPFGVDTPGVYEAWDELASGGAAQPGRGATNELEVAAVALEPRLLEWKDALAAASGRRPQLAGSGSTWFVEGSLAAPSAAGRAAGRAAMGWLRVGAERGLLVEVTTTPRHDGGAARA
jgi:4-diphosphocytidyl-2-C-methyl-D-erythritol kinase